MAKQWEGWGASRQHGSPPAYVPGYLPSHSYISAHIHMHAIRCCKQGCERADLAYMKSSKERVKGTNLLRQQHTPDIAVHSIA